MRRAIRPHWRGTAARWGEYAGMSAVLLAGAGLVFTSFAAPSGARGGPSVTSGPAAGPQQSAPSDAELRARAQMLIAHQHEDDRALTEYQFVEHDVSRTGGSNPQVVSDRYFRVVPTGGGVYRILLKDGTQRVSAEEYRRQLVRWEGALQYMLNPSDPRAQTARAKWEKKQRDRADLVAAINDAFIAKWNGQAMMDGYECDIVDLAPNPNFRPRSLLQEALTRATARIWVDQKSLQMVRGEAHIARDLAVGGGILGKLYRGSVFSIEQRPVAPDVWLPVQYEYHFTGRKFLFLFEQNQTAQMQKYRRLGTPSQALQVVRAELASGKTMDAGDP